MSHHPTLLVTLAGADRPGVSRDLFGTLAEFPVRVSDVEQLVIRGQLVLSVVVEALDAENGNVAVEQAMVAITRLAADLGLDLSMQPGTHEPIAVRKNRFQVTVLGRPLSPAQVALVAAQIAELGGNIDRIRRIADYPVTAIAFEGSGASHEELRRPLGEISSSAGIDIAVQDVCLESRGQHLLVMDVDSTLIQNEVIDLLAAQADRHDEVAAITEAAMAGEMDFAESLRRRVALLEGLPASVIDTVRHQIELTPGARTLVRTLRRLGYRIALVSGGFHEVVGPLAEELGIHEVRANRLGISNGILTGTLDGPIVDRQGKRQALEDFAASFGISQRRTIAIGDGANDIDMLEAAGLGIAFNAKAPAREAADTSVSSPYLDSVLFLLGITREEVETADEREGIRTPSPTIP